MMKSVLKPIISDIQCAYTIETGKVLVSKSKPDLVFVDNNLPDGKGADLVKIIKGVSPSSLVIFITAVGNIAKDKAIMNGADAYIEKPLTYSAIMKALGYTESRTGQLS